MKYAVHIYTAVRVKLVLEADSPVAAFQLVEQHADFQQILDHGITTIIADGVAVEVEGIHYAEGEITDVLVDPLDAAGAPDCKASVSLRRDGKDLTYPLPPAVANSNNTIPATVEPPEANADDAGETSTQADLMYPKVVVLCTNSEGSPEFHTCSPEVSRSQYVEGEHLEMAMDNARSNGYGAPMSAFDSTDPAARQLGEILAWI